MNSNFRRTERFSLPTPNAAQVATFRALLHPSSPRPESGLELLDWAIAKLESVLATQPARPVATR